jgi:hypothetical protein
MGHRREAELQPRQLLVSDASYRRPSGDVKSNRVCSTLSFHIHKVDEVTGLSMEVMNGMARRSLCLASLHKRHDALRSEIISSILQ